jgi:large subunit ribosomal protein L4
MELNIVDINGASTGAKAVLSDSIFGIEPNEHVLYLEVKAHLAQRRQGTHKAKERGEIAGSTRKIKKQKGTGTARAGSIKSPIFRGGGRIFGPEPRDYSQKINKKVSKLARKSALSAKAKANAITILDGFDMDTPKTSQYLAVMEKLGVAGKKSLVVLAEPNKNVYLSSRNLQGAKVVTSSELNTYDTMNASKVIIVKDAIKKIEETLS